MEARVITISDIFDAITADRPYRKAIRLVQTPEIMEKARGSAIDRIAWMLCITVYGN